MSRIPSRAFRRHPSFRGQVPTSSQAQFQRVFPEREEIPRTSFGVRKPPSSYGLVKSAIVVEEPDRYQDEKRPSPGKELSGTTPSGASSPSPDGREKSTESKDTEPLVSGFSGFVHRLKRFFDIGRFWR